MFCPLSKLIVFRNAVCLPVLMPVPVLPVHKSTESTNSQGAPSKNKQTTTTKNFRSILILKLTYTHA